MDEIKRNKHFLSVRKTDYSDVGEAIKRTCMKKIICYLIVSMVFLLVGCASKEERRKTNYSAEQQRTDYNAQTAIKEQIENTLVPRGYFKLLGDSNFVIVLCTNGEVTVTINAFANFTIPYVAEKFLPVAQEAARAAGVALVEFKVNSSNKSKDGVTFASWCTTDGEKGELVDNTSGKTVIISNLTIEQLYEEYADYKHIVNDMIVEAGGKTLFDIDCETVLTSLKDGGIPIIYSIIYTKENDPNILYYDATINLEYEQKANFADERIETIYDESEPKSGTIETFLTSNKATDRAESLRISGEDTYSIRILVDNVLIRLSKDYTKEQAKEIARIVGGTIHSIDGDLYAKDLTIKQTSYWINTETKKFHRENCSYIQGGQTTTESRSILIAKGYSPCKHCNP